MGMFTHNDDAGQPASGGLFQKSAPAASPALPPEVLTQLRDESRRLRMLEERFVSLRKSLQVNQQDGLSKHKKSTIEIRNITKEIDALKKDFNSLQDKITLVVTEMQQLARKDDVVTLQKYINLWEPIHFVTRNEVQRVVEEVLSKSNNNVPKPLTPQEDSKKDLKEE
jgi:hypothetical protein